MRILIRQGDGPAAAYAAAHEQRAALERARHQVQQPQPTPPSSPSSPSRYGLGDARQLRGIPAVGVKGGLGGAIPGTRPDAR